MNLYPFTAIHTKNSTAGIDILHPAVFVQYVWLTAFSSVFHSLVYISYTMLAENLESLV
ncbi:MAG: hypothetical protein R6W99_06655 [Clostridia bacterium]